MFPISKLRAAALHKKATLAVAAILLLPLAVLALSVRLFEPPPLLEGISFSKAVYGRGGRLMRLGMSDDQKYRLKLSLEEIPPEAIENIVRYEDKRFWTHSGVDVAALARASLSMLFGGRRMGGSTITMQVARLRLGLKTGSISDKLKQMLCALSLERRYSKAKILEAYFNLAPYGGNVEGLGAAALVYFGKPPGLLTSDESLALMLVPQNPVLRRPGADKGRLFKAVARIKGEWAKQGFIKDASAAPLRFRSPANLPFACPHLSGELLSKEGTPGKINTFIDPQKQRFLEKRLKSFSARGRAFGTPNAAAMLVHWPSAQIQALVGSANFFDKGISGEIDATKIRRSPGSTLKPFIYALALEQGIIHPLSLLSDMPRSFSGYDPENFDKNFRGPLPADEALRLSRNVPALTLAAKLKNPGLYGFLQSAEVKFLQTQEHYGLSLVLGGAEVTMRELAALYCMLANKGVWQPLRLYREQEDGRSQTRQLLSPEASFVALSMLESQDPELKVKSFGWQIPLRVKTGTSNGFRDAWSAGVVGPYVLVVWVGNFDNSPNPLLVGAKSALPLFKEIANGMAGRERLDDPAGIPATGLNLERIEVCAATGDLDVGLCPGQGERKATWFIPGVSPIKPTGILRKALVSKKTGLRACEQSEDAEETVLEFWPSELEQQFLRAGIVKTPPPPYAPECVQGALADSGPAPTIVSPKRGLVYHVRPKLGGPAKIALLAHAATGVKTLYWFADERFVGTSKPGESIFLDFPSKTVRLRVVDDHGRASVRTAEVHATR